MSDSRRIAGERVFCHQCSNEWDRAHGGLTCPTCGGEFVEILEPGTAPPIDEDREPSLPSSRASSPRIPPHPFRDHNPWADVPDPDEPDITTFEFNTRRGGHGTFSFTRQYVVHGDQNNVAPPLLGFPPPFGFGQQPGQTLGSFQTGPFISGGSFQARDPNVPPGPGQMQDLFSLIFQSMQAGGSFQHPRQRGGERPPNPFDLLGAILNPGNAQHGDMVWSQEAFDRILERLAEQNQGSTAPGPASENAIQALPTKKVDENMMGTEGKAECSICMDSVELGSNVTVLPCNHWFHRDCVTAWLKEHDTCPHCRQPITKPEETNPQPQSSRRRSHRQGTFSDRPTSYQGNMAHSTSTPDTHARTREAREQYYGARDDADTTDFERPRSRRHSSSQSDQNRRRSSAGNNMGGVTGWLRHHMNLG